MAKKKSLWYSITHQSHLDREGYIKLVRRVELFVVGGLVASIVIFLALALVGGIGMVVNVILGARPYIYALAFVAVFSGYCIRFVKWEYFLRVLGLKVGLKKSFSVYLSLYSMNITPGKIGRVVAAYTLSRITKIRLASIVPIVTVDIFTDFLGVAIVALLAALYFHRFVVYILLIDIVLLLPFAFILNRWLYNLLKRLFRRSNFIKNFTLYGEEYFRSQSRLNSPKVYLLSISVTVPAAILNAMALFFTLMAVGVVPSFSGSVFVQTSSLMFGMISGAPGNLGVTDASLAALLSSVFSLSVTTSTAATILTRLAELWFGVVLGSAFLFYTLRYWTASAVGIRKRKVKRQD
ncbi:MAG: flippase-like domain-containing protein [Candidatus Marsarchaeota archaeon]|jgi:uncharacterized protein (TIRG00374 family)|nr:flippase-like domain-containing protein [Candidatus Marsarchaeota archaeon]MCL5111654.1 flippase-like domain-containing protein [Candidatus Marsarchaeota archaeon]